MKGNLKISALAAAVAMFAMGTAAAQSAPDVNTSVDTDINIAGDIEALGWVEVGGYLNVGGDVNLDYDYDYNDNFTRNRNINQNSTTNYNEDTTVTNDVSNSVDNSFSSDITSTVDSSLSSDISMTQSHNLETNQEYSNIVRNEYGRTDVRSERDEHGVSVNIDKSLSLNSDITFTGAPTLSGDIEIDSAAIALVDNRQSNTENLGVNWNVDNDASAGDDVGSDASGNLQFNVAAGDNNVQDNAAAIAAADAGFAFGLADAEIFVNQYGAGNVTYNEGVTNSASLGNNAFAGATGNIGANIAAGNNNQQKNALAASTATSVYAQATVSSNQVSTGNYVSNAGLAESFTDTIEVALNGTVSGSTVALGFGGYEGSSSGTYEGSGNSYQSQNFYPDTWTGNSHTGGSQTGHIDLDLAAQGSVANPNNPGHGGLGFDNEESGTYQGSESGGLAFLELGVADLDASLAGTVTSTQWIITDHSNNASLSGGAFAGASGNIGVNLAAGTGNLQANSLAMAVAQAGANGGGGGGE